MEVSVEENSYIPNTQNNILTNALKDTKVSFVVLLIVIILIYIGIFFMIGNNKSENTPITNLFIVILEVILWIALIVIIYINITKYDNNNNEFQTKIENLFNTKLATLSVSSPPTDETNPQTTTKCEKDGSPMDEVFHVPNNIHTFEEAKEVCKQYDSRLASYDEVEQSYLEGGNWCSYGWSQDQLALFPTQKEIYNNLKTIPGHEHDCGRPGINGGYIKNPNVKFGVNCYGIKPKQSAKDEQYMVALNNTPVFNDSDKIEQKNKEQNNTNIVAPFNRSKWSQLEQLQNN